MFGFVTAEFKVYTGEGRGVGECSASWGWGIETGRRVPAKHHMVAHHAGERVMWGGRLPALEALRQELGGLRLSALCKRALAAGVDHERWCAAIENIDNHEDEDATAALVELIVAAAPTSHELSAGCAHHYFQRTSSHPWHSSTFTQSPVYPRLCFCTPCRMSPA